MPLLPLSPIASPCIRTNLKTRVNLSWHKKDSNGLLPSFSKTASSLNSKRTAKGGVSTMADLGFFFRSQGKPQMQLLFFEIKCKDTTEALAID
jgi:hypothetical protein